MMQTYRLTCEMLVPRPLPEVFQVFENPSNLRKITPPWMKFRLISPKPVPMKQGAIIDYRLQWFIVPLRWRTLITSYEPPHFFVDEQARGPYVFWRHRHDFRETPDGTLVSDTVDYALPFGPLGRLTHQWVVAANLKTIFTYRQEALNRLWGGGSQIHPPVIRAVP